MTWVSEGISAVIASHQSLPFDSVSRVTTFDSLSPLSIANPASTPAALLLLYLNEGSEGAWLRDFTFIDSLTSRLAIRPTSSPFELQHGHPTEPYAIHPESGYKDQQRR